VIINLNNFLLYYAAIDALRLDSVRSLRIAIPIRDSIKNIKADTTSVGARGQSSIKLATDPKNAATAPITIE